MNEYAIAIPNKTSEAFWKHRESSAPQNAGLIFERFAPDWGNESSNRELKRKDKEPKKEGLSAALNASANADKPLLEGWNRRWEQTAKAASAVSFDLQTEWRLIAGLGRKGMMEVGFTFHRYGFPYLPGSSIKGLSRAWAVIDIASKLDDGNSLKSLSIHVNQKTPHRKEPLGLLGALDFSLSQEQDEDFISDMEKCSASIEALELSKYFRVIFGTTEHGGHIIFFDAIPKFIPVLQLDIINPHYPEYYKEGGREYPTAWQSPIPVTFLAVAPGNTFRFAVGWRTAPIDTMPIESISPEKARKEWSWFKGTLASSQEKPNPILRQAENWLKNGLLELGAGGKTSAGYGYFTDANRNTFQQINPSSERKNLPVGYERGIVKEFGTQGTGSYGFIERSNGADIFVHRNNLGEGVPDLQPGQKVIFKVGKGNRGAQAMDVQLDI
jgi:CRISPR-associated protein Cmr6